MEETTLIYSKEAFLHMCMGIEGLCADLYHFYSKMFEDIPEASNLWKKTALEEENHRMQFELALRLVNEAEFEVSTDSLKRAYSIQNRLLRHFEQIKHHKPELLTAVSKAVEMEEKLADLHAHTSLHFKEESMQQLFKALSEADLDHVACMQRYRSNLDLSLCKMNA